MTNARAGRLESAIPWTPPSASIRSLACWGAPAAPPRMAPVPCPPGWSPRDSDGGALRVEQISTPKGSRTPVSGLRTRRPRPLDDGGRCPVGQSSQQSRFHAGVARLAGPAAVAELVDAQASGACVLRDVEVRLLSAASGRRREARLLAERLQLDAPRALAEKPRSGHLFRHRRLFKRATHTRDGLDYSLDEIEHGLLRGNRRPPYGLRRLLRDGDPKLEAAPSRPDPRIHFALNCGARSCPPVRTYTAEGVDRELEAATLSYMEAESELDREAGVLTLPGVVKLYRSDFGPDARAGRACGARPGRLGCRVDRATRRRVSKHRLRRIRLAAGLGDWKAATVSANDRSLHPHRARRRHRPRRPPDLQPDGVEAERRRQQLGPDRGRAEAPARPDPEPGRGGQGLREAREGDLRERDQGAQRRRRREGSRPAGRRRGHPRGDARPPDGRRRGLPRAARDRELPAAPERALRDREPDPDHPPRLQRHGPDLQHLHPDLPPLGDRGRVRLRAARVLRRARPRPRRPRRSASTAGASPRPPPAEK